MRLLCSAVKARSGWGVPTCSGAAVSRPSPCWSPQLIALGVLWWGSLGEPRRCRRAWDAVVTLLRGSLHSSRCGGARWPANSSWIRTQARLETHHPACDGSRFWNFPPSRPSRPLQSSHHGPILQVGRRRWTLSFATEGGVLLMYLLTDVRLHRLHRFCVYPVTRERKHSWLIKAATPTAWRPEIQ